MPRRGLKALIYSVDSAPTCALMHAQSMHENIKSACSQREGKMEGSPQESTGDPPGMHWGLFGALALSFLLGKPAVRALALGATFRHSGECGWKKHGVHVLAALARVCTPYNRHPTHAVSVKKCCARPPNPRGEPPGKHWGILWGPCTVLPFRRACSASFGLSSSFGPLHCPSS